jgi:hypothetical protein
MLEHNCECLQLGLIELRDSRLESRSERSRTPSQRDVLELKSLLRRSMKNWPEEFIRLHLSCYAQPGPLCVNKQSDP